MLNIIFFIALIWVCQRRDVLTQKRRLKMTEVAGFLCAGFLTAGSTYRRVERAGCEPVLQAVGLPADIDHVGMMEEPVQKGCRDDAVA